MVTLLAWSFAVARTTATFPGGGDEELLRFLGTVTPRTFVTVIDGERNWRPFSVPFVNGRAMLKDLSEQGKVRFRFESDPKLLDTAIDLDHWPRYAMKNNNEKWFMGRFKPWRPDSTFKIGMAIQSEKAYVTLSQLSRLYGGKLSWHVAFDHMRLAISTRDSSPDCLLPSVALALGAKIVQKSAGLYHLDADPAVFKTRMAGLEKLAQRRRIKKEYISFPLVVEFTGACYRAATVKQVKQILDGTPIVKIPIMPGSNMDRLIPRIIANEYETNSSSVRFLDIRDETKPYEANIDLWRGNLIIWCKPSAIYPKGSTIEL